MTVGDRIKERRIALNLSQDELAKKVGYKSRSSIQKIECARDLPLKKVSKMAAALDCSPSYLMGWEEEKEVSVEEMIMYADAIQDDGHVESAKYTAEQIEKAVELFEKYKKADNDIKAVVDTLLKRPQQES